MKYSLFKTADDSYTLKNHALNEHYHSNAGAWQEADLKYFSGCRVLKKSRDVNTLRLFEVGFGLGFNLLPILNHLEMFENRIEYISSEYDTDVFQTLLKEKESLYPKEFLPFFTELLENKCANLGPLSVTVLSGDVRQSIQSIEMDSIDAIFHDPFSPYKNTECWTKQFFEQEFRILKKDGILSTYSISTPVRSGMYQAGFIVWDGIGDQTKSGGTIATKSILEGLKPLPEKMKMKLFTSPERIPFIDSELTMARDEIKALRLFKKKMENYSDIQRV